MSLSDYYTGSFPQECPKRPLRTL